MKLAHRPIPSNVQTSLEDGKLFFYSVRTKVHSV